MLEQINLQAFEWHLRGKNFQPESIRAYSADIQQYLEWLSKRGIQSPLFAGSKEAQEYVAFLASPTHILRPGIVGAYSATTIARKVKVLRYFYNFLESTS